MLFSCRRLWSLGKIPRSMMVPAILADDMSSTMTFRSLSVLAIEHYDNDNDDDYPTSETWRDIVYGHKCKKMCRLCLLY